MEVTYILVLSFNLTLVAPVILTKISVNKFLLKYLQLISINNVVLRQEKALNRIWKIDQMRRDCL